MKMKMKIRSEEHTSELQSRLHLVCRLLLEKKNSFRPELWADLQSARPPARLCTSDARWQSRRWQRQMASCRRDTQHNENSCGAPARTPAVSRRGALRPLRKSSL